MSAVSLLVVAAAFLGLFAGPADAVETFSPDISGIGVIHAGGAGTGPTDPPIQLEVSFAWSGTVTVMTSSGADGTYAGADVLSFSGQGRINDEPPVIVPIPPSHPFGDFAGALLFAFDNTWFNTAVDPFIRPPVVTIANGIVTSINAAGRPSGSPNTGISFGDLTVGFSTMSMRVGGDLSFFAFAHRDRLRRASNSNS
jgi:hypothetical protein